MRRLPIWQRFALSESGAALVETALVLSLLGPPLLLGTVEIGGALNASIEMSNAAYAGAAYAAQYYIQHSSSALPTTTQVTSAAQNEAPELLNALAPSTSLTVNMYTGCGTGSPTAGNSVPSCSTGVIPYVKVTTQASVSPLIRAPGLTNLLTISGAATVNLVH
jgi:Flp pilus assembly protein TadG